MTEGVPTADANKNIEAYVARIAELEGTIRTIRDKVHAHNRGGELYAGLRDVIRDLCDRALSWK